MRSSHGRGGEACPDAKGGLAEDLISHPERTVLEHPAGTPYILPGVYRENFLEPQRLAGLVCVVSAGCLWLFGQHQIASPRIDDYFC